MRARAYDALLFSLVFLIFLGLLFGTLGSMHARSFKAVHLESGEDTGASTNLGMITFDGVSYSLPDDVSKTIGTYSAEYFTDAGYLFDHWETTHLVSVSDANANPTTVTVSGDGTLKAIYAAHHDAHLSDEYAPMAIPINDKNLTVAPIIMCTILENDVFKPFHYPCKSARTTFVDNDWSDSDANYTYVFEDWTDYDWNDIVVSLYATTNDMIEVEICLEDREATWKNPFSVEITPESLNVDVHWNSTDYPGDHVVRVNPNETVDIELFAESNPGARARITVTPKTYTLTITSASGGTTDPVPDSYLYDEGTVVSVTAVPDPGYDFDYWELDEVDTGSANPIDVTMNANHTLLAIFKQQSPPKYYLTVISPYGTPGGEGWYDNCTTAYATLDTSIVDHGNGTRRVFTHWSGDASGTDYSTSNLIHMDRNKTAVANWKTQYYLTVTSPYDSPTPTSGWFDAGEEITASVTSPWPGPTGVQYVCTEWTGTRSVPVSGTTKSVAFTINTPSSITWTWKTQYKLTVETYPAGLSPAPTPPTDWYDESTHVVLTAQTVSGYTFNYWDVNAGSQDSGVNPITVHMGGPHTATAHYQTAAPPPPVGGHAMPIDNSHLLAPKIDLVSGIGLASILLVAMAATIILIRRRNKRSSGNLKAP